MSADAPAQNTFPVLNLVSPEDEYKNDLLNKRLIIEVRYIKQGCGGCRRIGGVNSYYNIFPKTENVQANIFEFDVAGR
jgi:hypothetical protein